MKKIVLIFSTIIIIAMFILVACDTKTPEAVPLSNNETSETKETDELNKKEDEVVDSNVNTGESTKEDTQTTPTESTIETSNEETKNEPETIDNTESTDNKDNVDSKKEEESQSIYNDDIPWGPLH